MNARKCVHVQRPYPRLAFVHESSKVGGRGVRSLCNRLRWKIIIKIIIKKNYHKIIKIKKLSDVVPIKLSDVVDSERNCNEFEGVS